LMTGPRRGRVEAVAAYAAWLGGSAEHADALGHIPGRSEGRSGPHVITGHRPPASGRVTSTRRYATREDASRLQRAPQTRAVAAWSLMQWHASASTTTRKVPRTGIAWTRPARRALRPSATATPETYCAYAKTPASVGCVFCLVISRRSPSRRVTYPGSLGVGRTSGSRARRANSTATSSVVPWSGPGPWPGPCNMTRCPVRVA